jgi:signal transduction histidine kinase
MGRCSYEAIQTCKNGKRISVEIKTTNLKDESGNSSGYVSIVNDVTERKRIQAELAEVRRGLMEATESERLHIAQELHDGPMQDLYGLSFQMVGLKDLVVDSTGSQEFAEVQRRLQEVIQILRNMAYDLRPPALAPFGLEKAIRSHAEQLERAHPELSISLDLEPDGRTLPEQLRLGLYRIYQQALANVVRHSDARHATVRMRLEDERVMLEIEDDGRGFMVPPSWIDFTRQGHLGLAGAAERAEALGGALKVDSRPGSGTVLGVSAPRR